MFVAIVAHFIIQQLWHIIIMCILLDFRWSTHRNSAWKSSTFLHVNFVPFRRNVAKLIRNLGAGHWKLFRLPEFSWHLQFTASSCSHRRRPRAETRATERGRTWSFSSLDPPPLPMPSGWKRFRCTFHRSAQMYKMMRLIHNNSLYTSCVRRKDFLPGGYRWWRCQRSRSCWRR